MTQIFADFSRRVRGTLFISATARLRAAAADWPTFLDDYICVHLRHLRHLRSIAKITKLTKKRA